MEQARDREGDIIYKDTQITIVIAGCLKDSADIDQSVPLLSIFKETIAVKKLTFRIVGDAT